MQTSKTNDHIISHDPATVQINSQPVQTKSKLPTIIIAALGIVLITVGLIWYFNGQSFDFSKDETPEISYTEVDETIIATVGSENIYGEDLKRKKAITAQETLSPEMEASLLDRLIDESIILQAGEEKGYIKLSESVFNSPIKDQEARQKLITEVTKKVNDASSYKKGAFVSIWFMNFEPGPIGYDAGKQVALEKITELHSAVSSGSMTIKQAGETIRNDSTLQQLDSSYKANAYSEFDTRTNPEITFDQTFNEELLKLGENGLTEVYAAQDYDGNDPSLPPKDAVYMFGKVSEVEENENLPFEAWLAAEKNNYAIIKI